MHAIRRGLLFLLNDLGVEGLAELGEDLMSLEEFTPTELYGLTSLSSGDGEDAIECQTDYLVALRVSLRYTASKLEPLGARMSIALASGDLTLRCSTSLFPSNLCPSFVIFHTSSSPFAPFITDTVPEGVTLA